MIPIFTAWPRKSLMLYGLSGSGKTVQIGQLAKRLFAETGQHTRLCTNDPGGHDHIDAPYIEVEDWNATPEVDPFLWAERVVRGMVYRGGKWIKDPRPDIGLYAFDSASEIGVSMGKGVRDSWSRDDGRGIGAQAYVIPIGQGDDKLTIANLDKQHYGIVQNRLEDLIKLSFRLPGWVVWTASVRRLAEDSEVKVPLCGPELFGKALVSESLRWFYWTFPLVAEAQMGAPPRYSLYLLPTAHPLFGGATLQANARIPLEGKSETTGVPSVIEPANVVEALECLARRKVAADAEKGKG